MRQTAPGVIGGVAGGIKKMENEYKPWEVEGVSELEYYKRAYLRVVRELQEKTEECGRRIEGSPALRRKVGETG